MKVLRQSWYRGICGVAVNFDPRSLALVVSSQNFKSKHTGIIISSLRASFQAIQGAEITFSEKRLSRNLPGLVPATHGGAVFSATGSSSTEFIRCLQSEQQEAFHNVHSP